MAAALNYIEEHLASAIDYQEAARLARCSEYHFRRMFSFMAGIPLSEYIRCRRLTLAAFDLAEHGTKVEDTAKKYGYSSPDAFSRAFRELHGIPPSEAGQSTRPLKAWPRISFHLTIKHITIKGEYAMNYRLVTKDAFRIIGIKKRVPIQFEGVNPEIERMWKQLPEETIRELKQLGDTDPAGLIQASVNFSEGRMEEKGNLDHYIGVAVTKEPPHNFEQLEVAPSTWAVFESAGPFPETLQTTWGRIYSEWFPSSDFQLKEGPEILRTEGKDVSSPLFKSEIWIPVEKK